MILSIDTQDARDIKALQLAATAATWVPLSDGSYGVPSSDRRRQYRVTAETCDCADSQRGQTVCKHRRACRIFLALRVAADPTPQTSRFAKMSEAELFARL